MGTLARRLCLLGIFALIAIFLAACGPTEEERYDQWSRDHEQHYRSRESLPTPTPWQEPPPEEQFREAEDLMCRCDSQPSDYDIERAADIFRRLAMCQGLSSATPRFHAAVDAMVSRGMLREAAHAVSYLQGNLKEQSWTYVECVYDRIALELRRQGFDFRRDYLHGSPLFDEGSEVPALLWAIADMAEFLGRHPRQWRRHEAIANLYSDGHMDKVDAFLKLHELGDHRAMTVAARRISEDGGEQDYDMLVEAGFTAEAQRVARRPFANYMKWFLYGDELSPSDREEAGFPRMRYELDTLNEALVWGRRAGMTTGEIRRYIGHGLSELEENRPELAIELHRKLGDSAMAMEMEMVVRGQ